MNGVRNLALAAISLTVLLAYNNCAKSGFNIPEESTNLSSNTDRTLPIIGNEANVMKLTIACNYINQPCVSVTICEPGTTNCQTIDKILIDTGSYGLRVFSSLVALNLEQNTINENSLAECVSYADGSSNWGPVKTADVVLGSLKAPSIRIQMIDANFATIPGDCTKPDTNPAAAGYNGILGVGIFTEDCGIGCATIPDNRIYFACNANTCSPTTVPIAQQVSNPVSFLPTNNNGVIFQLPSIPSEGSTTASGYVVLGIGTQANNTPAGPINFFPADSAGFLKTTFNGATHTNSSVDSGSNGLFFPGTDQLPPCAANSGASGFFCPATPLNFTAYQGQTPVTFEIQHAANAMISSPHFMFSNIGGHFADAFYWGLPFYFGRTIYHGIEGKSSTLGTGPYWAW